MTENLVALCNRMSGLSVHSVRGLAMVVLHCHLRKSINTLEQQLLSTYVNKGSPGQGLSIDHIETIVAMAFKGQDCYELIEHEGMWILQNGQDERTVEGLTGPLEMKVDNNSRVFLKSKNDKRLAAPKVFCDTLLAPIVLYWARPVGLL